MKKIKQWLIGCLISLWGAYNCIVGYGVLTSFVGMMKFTGKEFVGHFVGFVLCLLFALFMPLLMFQVFKNGVKEEYK